MPHSESPSAGRLLLVLAGFLVFGAPAVFVVWEDLSQILYGNVHRVRYPVFFLALVVLAIVIAVLGAYVRRLQAGREAHP